MTISDAESRRLRFLIWGLCGLIGVLLLKYVFFSVFPIYPDEVSYRISTTRYLIDGHVRITSWAACASSYALPLPLMMKIGAYILSPLSAIIHFGVFRLIAIVILLVAAIALPLSARQFKLSLKEPEVMATLLMLIVFIMTIQTFSPSSVAMFMLRGEYLLFLSFPLLLFAASRKDALRVEKWAWYGCTILLFVASCCLHPKTLFFVPFFVGFIWFLFKGSSFALRAALLAPVALAAKHCLVASAQMVKCPEFPAMQALNSSFNINPIDLLKGKPDALSDFFTNNTFANFLQIVHKGLFSTNYIETAGVDYFPSVGASNGWNFIGYPVANAFILACFLLIFIGMGCVLFQAAIRFKEIGKERERDILWLAGIGIACTILHFLHNRARQFYDFGIWSYILALFIAFGLLAVYSLRKKEAIKDSPPRCYCLYILLAAFFLFGNIAEAFLLQKIHYRAARHGWSGIGTPVLNVSKENPSGVDWHEEYKRVQSLLPSCGVKEESARLIVDDRVYPYVQKHPKPVQLTWLWFIHDQEMSPDISLEARFSERWKHTLAFMKTNGMAAVVGYCPSFGILAPDNLLVRETNDWNHSFCCLRAPE